MTRTLSALCAARWWIPLYLCACTEGVHQAEPVDCDPLSGGGCPANAHCRVLAEGATACLTLADAGVGCTPASCPPGQACVEVEGLLSCQALCDLEVEGCGEEGVCAYALSADRPWGICPPPCALGGCGAGATCAPSTATPYPLCVATGAGALGDLCGVERCGAGLGCLVQAEGPRCARLCSPDDPSTCPGQCTGTIEGSTLRFCAEALK